MTLSPSGPRNVVFNLEHALNRLYEVVFPPGSYRYHPSGRASKVILAESLGELAGDDKRRRLWTARQYCKVDMQDFFDFATSPLCPAPKLSDYEQGVIWIYESF